jgi:hypothetical protein
MHNFQALSFLTSINAALAALLAPLADFDHFLALVGALFFLDLLAYLPMFEPFFGSSSKLDPSCEGRPMSSLSLQLLWLASALALMAGGRVLKLAASIFFYATFRHFYINSRWSSIRRGGGAPGFMSHWTAFFLVLLQLSTFLDGTGWLTHRMATMARLDFAVIMICAGVYKYMIGYLKNDGMEYGRVNPLWGYRWRRDRHIDPAGLYETFSNIMGSLVEITSGIMMLHRGTEVIGATMISLSFVFIGTMIRLGRLAWLMAVLPLIYCPNFETSLVSATPFSLPLPGPVIAALGALALAYMMTLPLVKFTQYYNLFANRNLPQPLQRWITSFANAVPIIIWRVFTPDVTNFYVRIYAIEGEREVPILCEDTYGLRDWQRPWRKLRFLHVTESIALTSVFTTLKYFPSNRELFDQKLLTYARTLGQGLKKLRFEYVSIQKLPIEQIALLPQGSVYGDHDGSSARRADGRSKVGNRFAFVHVGNFYVNLEKGRVYEEKLLPGFDFSAPSRFSPVRESAAPGSYVKKS